MEKNKDITEIKETGAEQIVFDLKDEKERENLISELGSGNMYFKPDPGIAYKILLTDSKVIRVDKQFPREDGTVENIVKYGIQIKGKGADKSEFEGLWEVGSTVLNAIAKDYDENATFTITKTGTGLHTKYNIVKDF